MAKAKKEKSAFDKLTPVHKKFVTAYLECFNGCKAYQIAYPKVKPATTRTNGSRLLKQNNIQAALKEHFDALWDNKDDYIGRTLKQLMNIVDFDIADYIDDTGNIDIQKVKELNSYPIVEVTKRVNETKYGQNTHESIKTADKLKAISEITKILGMIQEKVEHTGTIEVIPAERPKTPEA